MRRIEDAGGWLGFDRFMELALYAPGLGYYASSARQFGLMPSSGSDFVTAPELSPLFGHTLARQVEQALAETGTDEIWEFGAGSGALALQLLDALGGKVKRYTIVDLSGALRERQQQALARHGDKVRWVDALPERMRGVIVGNEVLDSMPVKLLARVGGNWNERGVALHQGQFSFADVPTDLRPPVAIDSASGDYLTEIHLEAEAFIRTIADKLERGAAFFIDYGFPESEYYHPQRHMGTVMCHRGHQSDGNPLADVGGKDITAHVNFSGIALAAQDAGLDVLGYTSQGRFLINCGLLQIKEQQKSTPLAQMDILIMEHEMGELFKVLGLSAGGSFDAIGFARGDRTHTL
ncbi:MAG: SAM-dependent methyltransferase [Burkholderiales bacterium]